MNRARYRTAGTLVVAGLFGLACFWDSTAPKPPPGDLRPIFREMSWFPNFDASTFTSEGSQWLMWRLRTRPNLVPTGCTFSPSAQDFVCAPVTLKGITLARTYTLYDAAGHPQSHPDANTASVQLQTITSGTTTFSGGGGGTSTFTIDRQEDKTLSAINTGQHILNGVSVGIANGTGSYNGATSTSFSFTDADTTLNLALPVAGSGPRWPQSGSMRSHTVGTDMFLGYTHPIGIDMIVTFDGNNTATFVTARNGSTKTCTADLSNPQSISTCFP